MTLKDDDYIRKPIALQAQLVEEAEKHLIICLRTDEFLVPVTGRGRLCYTTVGNKSAIRLFGTFSLPLGKLRHLVQSQPSLPAVNVIKGGIRRHFFARRTEFPDGSGWNDLKWMSRQDLMRLLDQQVNWAEVTYYQDGVNGEFLRQTRTDVQALGLYKPSVVVRKQREQQVPTKKKAAKRERAQDSTSLLATDKKPKAASSLDPAMPQAAAATSHVKPKKAKLQGLIEEFIIVLDDRNHLMKWPGISPSGRIEHIVTVFGSFTQHPNSFGFKLHIDKMGIIGQLNLELADLAKRPQKGTRKSYRVRAVSGKTLYETLMQDPSWDAVFFQFGGRNSARSPRVSRDELPPNEITYAHAHEWFRLNFGHPATFRVDPPSVSVDTTTPATPKPAESPVVTSPLDLKPLDPGVYPFFVKAWDNYCKLQPWLRIPYRFNLPIAAPDLMDTSLIRIRVVTQGIEIAYTDAAGRDHGFEYVRGKQPAATDTSPILLAVLTCALHAINDLFETQVLRVERASDRIHRARPVRVLGKPFAPTVPVIYAPRIKRLATSSALSLNAQSRQKNEGRKQRRAPETIHAVADHRRRRPISDAHYSTLQAEIAAGYIYIDRFGNVIPLPEHREYTIVRRHQRGERIPNIYSARVEAFIRQYQTIQNAPRPEEAH
ncbi:hypothetical protein D3C72_359150 [compost metagenome]